MARAPDRDTKGLAMNTTHDDNATTWRDFADHLTPATVKHFEACDHFPVAEA
jgi:hypothetical protein